MIFGMHYFLGCTHFGIFPTLGTAHFCDASFFGMPWFLRCIDVWDTKIFGMLPFWGHINFWDVPVSGMCRFLGMWAGKLRMIPTTSVELWCFLGIFPRAGIPGLVVFFGNSLDFQGREFLQPWCFLGIPGLVVFFESFLDSQEPELLGLWCFLGIAWIPKVWNSWRCGAFGNGFDSQGLEFL